MSNVVWRNRINGVTNRQSMVIPIQVLVFTIK